MNKSSLALLSIIFLMSCSDGFSDSYPVVFAHRGCWLGDSQTEKNVTQYYVPENSVDGVRMAARMGYPTIELDARWTLDSVLVCMHDGTINRTMRNAVGQTPIGEPVAVTKTAFEDLRSNYRLASSDPEMRRPIPTLEEILNECKACGIKPIMHCDIPEGYDMAVRILGQEFIAFGSNFRTFLHAREIAPDCLILFDARVELGVRGLENTAENINAILEEIGGNIGTSSMGMAITAPDMIAALHEAGHPVQSSIYPRPNEAYAVRNGADILLSDFCWRPAKDMKPARRVCLNAADSSASAEFDECELGALTLSIKGTGSCTVTVRERAFTGVEETFTYEFGGEGEQVAERLSYRFWRNAVSVKLDAASASSFKLSASLYEL